MIDFNINHYVFVRLTPRGHTAHAEHWMSLGLAPRTIQEDAEGWSRWQLWDLMNVFGTACTMGFDPPFNPNIRIDTQSPFEPASAQPTDPQSQTTKERE